MEKEKNFYQSRGEKLVKENEQMAKEVKIIKEKAFIE